MFVSQNSAAVVGRDDVWPPFAGAARDDVWPPFAPAVRDDVWPPL